MAGTKHRDIWQFGDFQTPAELASQVCEVLLRRGVAAPAIVEPTCGRGAFLVAAACAFPHARTLLGVEINRDYVAEASAKLKGTGNPAGVVEQGDFFATDWENVLARDAGAWLILGNPPWVTNTELGFLDSSNLPKKSNFQGHQGLDAITGKANFDISEWMLLEQLSWLKNRSGWIAVLIKTAVARKVLKQAWKRHDPVGRAAIFRIDAMKHFGAAVDACLFVLPVNQGKSSQDCDVFRDLSASDPVGTIGFHDHILVSDVPTYLRHQKIIGINKEYIWRSGVKHDCSKVMELTILKSGQYLNGHGQEVDLEDTYLFPMMKSSDVAKGYLREDRYMIVTQRIIGENTSQISSVSPKTWRYLNEHSEYLNKRGSIVYKKNPRFSVFGVGNYTFYPWKIAISGFYNNLKFMKVGQLHGKPYVFDDTIYFLSCWSEAEADFVLSLVLSKPFGELMESIVFRDGKRPITADLLKKISLERVAGVIGLAEDYKRFRSVGSMAQLDLALVG